MSKKAAENHDKQAKRPFGGRSTSTGVGYEVDVAAWMASRMLIGGEAEIIDGLPALSVSSVALQTDDVIDDVVLEIRGGDAKVFISAKRRTAAVPVGASSKTFVEVVESMVDQYHAISSSARCCSRFVWALPSTAGTSATHHLPEALRAYRAEMPAIQITDFLRRRSPRERTAVSALINIVKKRWRKLCGSGASHEIISEIISRIHVEVLDFESGARHERMAAEGIGSSVVMTSSDGRKVWRCLREMLGDANRRGLKLRCQQLRTALTEAGIGLKSELDYAADVDALTKMTRRKMARLREHRYLRFGASSEDEVHLARTEDANALLAASARGHRLLTGEPGCGKSGLVHGLVEELQKKGCPVVLVLAEEIGGGELMNGSGIPALTHALDDVLSHWPNGTSGYLITDALDAVRDPDLHAELLRLLESVLRGESCWTVIASVREFDLKHSQHLRALFPGEGADTHSAEDFKGVSHFHLDRLREQDLDELLQKRPEIVPFIESARASQRSESLHRSPFFLRLAADLLRSGIPSSRLADWSSPTLLLRKFWESRVGEGVGDGDREVVLQAVCRLMMTRRTMSLSIKELSFNSAQRGSVNDLRSRGLLQSPLVKHGMRIGDEIVHLLHDYALARALIPAMATPFVRFAISEPLAPVFYRQGFLMALDELWDGPDGVQGFWQACLELEECPQLHSFTRILAPLQAARRVTNGEDLLPLIEAVRKSTTDDSAAMKAALHLSSALQDAAPEVIKLGASAWCEYAKKLAELLSEKHALESPLLFLLDRIVDVGAAKTELNKQLINESGRLLLRHHLAKTVNTGWRFVAATATKAICRTFNCNPEESERVFLAMLSPERVEQFPHEDLFDLAQELKHLGANGNEVVRRLFDVAFSTEPQAGEHRTNGSLILSLRTETRQDWNLNRYVLGTYYQGAEGMDAGLATTLVCIAWNAAEDRRDRRWASGKKGFQSTFLLRGVECVLRSDGCSAWGRQFENDENNILDAFSRRLQRWCMDSQRAALESVVNAFAKVNRSSVMWLTVLETASEYPAELGMLFAEAVYEPMILTMPAFRYGGVALFSALHRLGNRELRERLERTLLSLPSTTPLSAGEPREPVPTWILYAQNLLLGGMEEGNIALEETRSLWQMKKDSGDLEQNSRPVSLTPYVPSLRGSLMPDRPSSVDAVADAVSEVSMLLEALKDRNNYAKVKGDVVCADIALLKRADRLAKKLRDTHPDQAADLWGRMVQVCNRIAGRRSPPRAQELMVLVRKILLRAAADPVPIVTEQDSGTEDHLDTWGWPSPRSDAAEGLPFVVCRLRGIDMQIISALRLLVKDGSRVVRFKLAESIWALNQIAPDLMWELMDVMIEFESKFLVLNFLLGSLHKLRPRDVDNALLRMKRIAIRAASAPKGHDIHKNLTGSFLFHHLRTGDQTCWDYVAAQIERCEDGIAAEALMSQLHSCRSERWLTAGDAIVSDSEADEHRLRAWRFFRELLFAAQQKLARKREEWQHLHSKVPIDEVLKEEVAAQTNSLSHIVDGIASQLYFGSGAFVRQGDDDEDRLSSAQMRRYWNESRELFEALANEPHPHTAQHVVQSMHHLMHADPERTFLCAAKSIEVSNAWGFLRESLVVDDIVMLVQRLLADHRQCLRVSSGGNSACLEALLRVLDLFVDAGWPKARQLTHRLEDIYR